MPPKQRITKEMIMEASLSLVREGGIESVNSRAVAAKIGCSTQPVFSQYPTMEDLRQAIHDYGCEEFEQTILAEKDSIDFLKKSCIALIQLARNDKNVFSLIFLSTYCAGSEFQLSRMNYKTNQLLLSSLIKNYSLTNEEALNILERLSLLVHGIASIIATTNAVYSDTQAWFIINQTFNDMIKGLKNIHD
jgi:AcrR family transcriptional regulator